MKGKGEGVGVLVPSFEGLKIISVGNDGGRERVEVPWSRGDKHMYIGEWSDQALLQFNRKRMLGVGK